MEQPGINSEAAEKVLQKDLENVVRKVAAGKTLTTAERARVEAMAAGSQDSTAHAKNLVHLSEILGVTRRTLSAWRKIDGAPSPAAKFSDWFTYPDCTVIDLELLTDVPPHAYGVAL